MENSKTTLNEEHFANLQVNQLFSKTDTSHSLLDVLLIENIEIAVTNPKNLLLLQFLTSTEKIKEILIFFELDSQLTSTPECKLV
jgi:hypothetical protein